jgi:hypothetical protein
MISYSKFLWKLQKEEGRGGSHLEFTSNKSVVSLMIKFEESQPESRYKLFLKW